MSHFGLSQFCLQLLSVSSLYLAWKIATWEIQKDNIQHLDYCAPFFYEASDETLCLQKEGGLQTRQTDRRRGRIVVHELFKSFLKQAFAHDDRWAPRFGVSQAVIFQNFFSLREKEISCEKRIGGIYLLKKKFFLNYKNVNLLRA